MGRVFVIGMLVSVLAACEGGAPQVSGQGFELPCYRVGCSGQVCSELPSVVTDCQWQPEYECLKLASCQRDVDAGCVWRETLASRACMAELDGGS